MTSGIHKAMTDIAWELKGIKNILASMWESRYKTEETSLLNPQAFADEYISVEECAKRLNVAEQTIRNWIAAGKKDPKKGWTEGVHYINISPEEGRKGLIRVPWNHLVKAFSKNEKIKPLDLLNNTAYQPHHNRLDNGSPF
jgi:hypothetical protein